MPPFDALMARISQANITFLANAEGVLAGAPMQGIYRRTWAPQTMLGQQVGATAPSIEVLDAVVPADWAGTALQITAGHGVGHYVISQCHPDGSGLTTLVLEDAP
jgi:hypothetical protein